jgi:hypothetical protein
MTPQAMRLPEAPLGSVFSSSAFSWTTMEVPPLRKRELGAVGSSEMVLRTKVAVPVWSSPTETLEGRSPVSVLLLVGVEVAAGGLEVGGFADGVLVDVDAVLAEGQVLEVEGELDALLDGLEGGGAGGLAGGGEERDLDLCGGGLGAGRRCEGEG